MTGWGAFTLDAGHAQAYSRAVDDGDTQGPGAHNVIHDEMRRRRRPPSLREQQVRTARIRPWADLWKQLKAGGRWR